MQLSQRAARQFKLDFHPIVKERYMLRCKTDALTQPAISELIGLLKGPEFAHVMKPVAGHVRLTIRARS
jgi:molybdate-binding protein